MHELWKSKIPAGELGSIKVIKREVSEDDARFHNMRAVWSPGARTIDPGVYTELHINNSLVMSDTPAEYRDHSWFIYGARGHVLLNGLGLGCVLACVLPKVDRVTVVEINEDVIAYVGPHFNDPKVEIVYADALEWRPPKGTKYDAVWHDIWPNICSDNINDMKRLHRKYGRRTDWQGSWCRELCARYA